jgi:hypothetical protein
MENHINLQLIRRPDGTECYGITGLSREDLLLLSVAIKPHREELARRLDDLRDPTIRTLTSLSSDAGSMPDIEKLCLRLAQFSELFTGTPIKNHKNYANPCMYLPTEIFGDV